MCFLLLYVGFVPKRRAQELADLLCAHSCRLRARLGSIDDGREVLDFLCRIARTTGFAEEALEQQKHKISAS